MKVRDGGRVETVPWWSPTGWTPAGTGRSSAWTWLTAEDGALAEFLRSLVARGLAGVQLVISDAHQGLKDAIAQVLGAPWQRCTVHWACADSSWWLAGG